MLRQLGAFVLGTHVAFIATPSNGARSSFPFTPASSNNAFVKDDTVLAKHFADYEDFRQGEPQLTAAITAFAKLVDSKADVISRIREDNGVPVNNDLQRKIVYARWMRDYATNEAVKAADVGVKETLASFAAANYAFMCAAADASGTVQAFIDKAEMPNGKTSISFAAFDDKRNLLVGQAVDTLYDADQDKLSKFADSLQKAPVPFSGYADSMKKSLMANMPNQVGMASFMVRRTPSVSTVAAPTLTP